MIVKDDGARALWGPAYDRVPKSVFALVAWHLADGSVKRVVEEIESLKGSGDLSVAQANRVLTALR